MVSSTLRYFLMHPLRTAAAIGTDPFEAWTTFHERYAASRESPVPLDLYKVEEDWQLQLHQLLGVAWPCPAISEFWALWPRVIKELEVSGIQVGPESFKGWNDGDPGFVRAIWCLVRHLRAHNVVETGVAHGLTSRFILEALEINGIGRLWSIDHPPLEKELHSQIGIAVPTGRHPRWSYIRGSSKRRLPALLSQLGSIDLFIHDSLHSTQNVRFEMEQAWLALRPGGAIVVDDIDANRGFRSFIEANPGFPWMVCEAEPLRPDLRRFNNKGLFGIVVKEPVA